MSSLYWTQKEDEILVLLRSQEFTLREISKGLFHRTRNAVGNRLIILQRTHDIR